MSRKILLTLILVLGPLACSRNTSRSPYDGHTHRTSSGNPYSSRFDHRSDREALRHQNIEEDEHRREEEEHRRRDSGY